MADNGGKQSVSQTIFESPSQHIMEMCSRVGPLLPTSYRPWGMLKSYTHKLVQWLKYS